MSGNTYGAHIFKRRQVGEREEVTIKLFSRDGSPLVLDGSGPSTGPGAIPMLYKGEWDVGMDYAVGDVVRYDSETYIFDETHAAGELPSLHDMNAPPNPVTKFFDPALGHVDLVLNADSPVGAGVRVVAEFDMVAIKIAQAGNLALLITDPLHRGNDMFAYLWRQRPELTWDLAFGDDDSAGERMPYVQGAVTPGVYLLMLGPLNGSTPQPGIWGTYHVESTNLTTAVIGSFVDFPVAKVTQIG